MPLEQVDYSQTGNRILHNFNKGDVVRIMHQSSGENRVGQVGIVIGRGSQPQVWIKGNDNFANHSYAFELLLLLDKTEQPEKMTVGDTVWIHGVNGGCKNKLGDIGRIWQLGDMQENAEVICDNGVMESRWSNSRDLTIISDAILTLMETGEAEAEVMLKEIEKARLKDEAKMARYMKTKKYARDQFRLKRTIFDYRLITKEIKDDYLDILSIFTESIEKGKNNYTIVYSPKKFFFIDGSSLYVMDKFGKGRNLGNSFDKSTVLASDRGTRVTFYNAESGYFNNIGQKEIIFEKLLKIAHQFLIVQGYAEKGSRRLFGNGDSRVDYTLHQTADASIRSVVKAVLDNDSLYQKLDKFNRLMHYNRFAFDEIDKKVHFHYKNRKTVMKIGKGIKRMFRVLDLGDISDEQVKRCNDRLVASTSDFVMKVVSGDDIDKYYLGSNYDHTFPLGSLGTSCMKYQSCIDDDFFAVYKENCEMLILVHPDTDLIIGRALLWKADFKRWRGDEDVVHDLKLDYKIGDTVPMMDRIYAKEVNYSKFFDWAKENGYFRKRYQSYDNEMTFVPPNGDRDNTVDILCKIDIDLTSYSRVPYMDTFAWGDGGEIRNSEDFGTYNARDTDGNLGGWDDDEDW